MLPSGPRWKSQIIPTSHPTKSPVILYWRDPLECIASIFNHLLFHNRMDFTPRKVYTTAERLCRIYTEWMTGNDAWDMQVRNKLNFNVFD
jgi:Plavaka transposase